MLAGIDEAVAGCQAAIAIIKRYYADNADVVERFGNFPSLYAGLVTEDGSLEHYDGKMRFIDAEGKVIEDGINPADYLDYVAETTEEWSYLKFPYFKRMGYPEGAYRVGPLGRLNVAESARTPLANEELNSFKAVGNGRPVQGTLYYHYARMIEALYAVERARQLLEDPEAMGGDIVATTSNALQPRGVGVIEAPRGTLFHDYHVDENGRLERVNLIVSTGQNNVAMNEAVASVAREWVDGNKLREGMLNRVEAAIRAYDPCLSCSTHAVGRMPLAVELIGPDGEPLDRAIR
jgi:NAD-reducing hydrogenase large subunit